VRSHTGWSTDEFPDAADLSGGSVLLTAVAR